MPKLRPTKCQMKRLVELVKNDPQLFAGKFSPNFTYKLARERWMKIANELNALPGAEKSHEKWRKAWQDTRVTAKIKATAIKKHTHGTGGGQSRGVVLSESQMDVLPIINQVAVSGQSKSSESIVNCDFSNIEDGSKQYCNSSSFASDYEIKEEPFEELTTFETAPKKKRSLSAERWQQSNDVANRMADLKAKKLELKSAYYCKKLKLMEDNNALLSNINILLKSYINTKSDEHN